MARLVMFAAVVVAASCQAGGGSSSMPPPRLEMIEAPATTDVAAAVAAQVASATGGHKRVVVYVGATWCEPCRYFHDAAAAGQLDDQLGDLRVVAFDMDRDRDALGAAGYVTD